MSLLKQSALKKKMIDLKAWNKKANKPITANINKAKIKNGSPRTYKIPLPNVFNKLTILIF